jgi:hypothetical protein
VSCASSNEVFIVGNTCAKLNPLPIPPVYPFTPTKTQTPTTTPTVTPTNNFINPCDPTGNYIYDSTKYASSKSATWAANTTIIQNVTQLYFNSQLTSFVNLPTGTYLYVENPNNMYDYGYFLITSSTNNGLWWTYGVTVVEYGCCSFNNSGTQGYSFCVIEGYTPTLQTECLTSLQIIVAFVGASQEANLVGAPCYGGHVCNNAVFDVLINGINVGTFSMNNAGGPTDLQNYPPWYNGNPNSYNGRSRYSEITIGPLEAQQIVAASPGQTMLNIFYTGNAAYPNPHNGVTWIRIFQNGVQIYEICPEQDTTFTIDPCETTIPPTPTQTQTRTQTPTLTRTQTPTLTRTPTYTPSSPYKIFFGTK